MLITFTINFCFALSKRKLNTIENSCVCHINIQANLDVSSDEKLGSCVDLAGRAANSVYNNPSLRLNEDQAEEAVLELLTHYQKQNDNDENYKVCNANQVKDWFKTYKSFLDESPEKLKLLVDQNICEARFCDRRQNLIELTELDDYPGNLPNLDIPRNVQVCDNSPRTFSQVRSCRNSLVEMLAENIDSVHENCSERAGQIRGGRLINNCIKINIYNSLILNEKEDIFNKEFCENNINDELSMQDCVNEMDALKVKFATQIDYLKNEIELCNDSKFVTDKAKTVCRSVIVNKLLNFATNEERINLFKCIREKPENEVAQCYQDFLLGQNQGEQELLAHIENQYCSHLEDGEDEQGRNPRKQCVKSMIAHFMNEMQMPDECIAEQDEIKKSQCIRRNLYSFILEQDYMQVQDCWNKERFPTLGDREACTAKNKELFDIIKNCNESFGSTGSTLSRDAMTCMVTRASQNGERDAFAIQEYLSKLAANINFEAQQNCMNAQSFKTDCLVDIIDGVTYAQLSTNNCPMQEDPETCYRTYLEAQRASVGLDPNSNQFYNELLSEAGQSGVMSAELITTREFELNNPTGSSSPLPISSTNPQTGNGTSNTVQVTENLDSNVAQTLATAGIGTASVLALNRNSGTTASNSNNNNSPPPSLPETSQDRQGKFISLVKDWKYMWIKGSDPACKALRRTAWARMGGLVLGVTTITIAGIKGAKAMKDKGEKQGNSWKGMGIIFAGAAAGALIKHGANLISKKILGSGLAAEQARFNTQGTFHYCRKEEPNNVESTTSLPLRIYQKDFENIQNMYIAQIKAAKSREEVDKIFNELESYINGDDLYNFENDENKFYSQSKIELSFLKESLISAISNISGLIMSNAHADNTSNEGVQSTAQQILMNNGFEENYKLDKDLTKVPSLFLLYDYDQAVGTGIVDSQRELQRARFDENSFINLRDQQITNGVISDNSRTSNSDSLTNLEDDSD